MREQQQDLAGFRLIRFSEILALVFLVKDLRSLSSPKEKQMATVQKELRMYVSRRILFPGKVTENFWP